MDARCRAQFVDWNSCFRFMALFRAQAGQLLTVANLGMAKFVEIGVGERLLDLWAIWFVDLPSSSGRRQGSSCSTEKGDSCFFLEESWNPIKSFLAETFRYDGIFSLLSRLTVLTLDPGDDREELRGWNYPIVLIFLDSFYLSSSNIGLPSPYFRSSFFGLRSRVSHPLSSWRFNTGRIKRRLQGSRGRGTKERASLGALERTLHLAREGVRCVLRLHSFAHSLAAQDLKLYKIQLKLNVCNYQIKVLYGIERDNIFLRSTKKLPLWVTF